MKKTIFSALLIFSLCIANAQWVRINGTGGFNVSSLITMGTVIIKGTDEGVFTSANSGKSWTEKNSGLATIGVNAMTACGGNLFAGTNNGVYLSTDTGTSWVLNYTFNSQRVTAMYSKGVNIYTATAGAFYVSIDNGANWKEIDSGLNSPLINCILEKGTKLFIGCSGGMIYRSSNKGAGWGIANNGLAGGDVYSLYDNGAQIFAGTDVGISVSTDYGYNWTSVSNNSAKSLVAIGSNLFAGTASGVFISKNTGSTWTALYSGLFSPIINVLMVKDSSLFAGTKDRGIIGTSDNGNSWVTLNTGFSSSTSVSSFAFNGVNMYVGTPAEGIYLSSNLGKEWNLVNNGLPSMNVHALTFFADTLFAGIFSAGIYRSTNFGASWKATKLGLTGTYEINSIKVNGAQLYAGTDIWGLYRSLNNGKSWSPVNSGLNNLTITSLIPSGPKLFAGTLGGVSIFDDADSNWTLASTGLTYWGLRVNSLVQNGQNLFAGTEDGVFISNDNGLNWSAASKGLTNKTIVALASYGNSIFAGTNGGGVFVSSDFGNSWSAMNIGLNGSGIWLRCLSVNGDKLFAGTDGGAFISDLSLLSGISRFSASENIKIYPNPFIRNTKVEFVANQPSKVLITLYNSIGQEISIIENNVPTGIPPGRWLPILPGLSLHVTLSIVRLKIEHQSTLYLLRY